MKRKKHKPRKAKKFTGTLSAYEESRIDFEKARGMFGLLGFDSVDCWFSWQAGRNAGFIRPRPLKRERP